jgi:glyoxylase-like metal-dependent hydrolase (beta-lactamase superfamily II)
MKTSLLAGVAALGALVVLAGPVAAQPARQPALDEQLAYATDNPQSGPFTVVPLRTLVQVWGQEGMVTTQNGVYVLQGPDGNVTLFTGPEGSVVIDASKKPQAAALVAKLKELNGPNRPIRFFFATNGDAERIESGVEVRRSGKAIFGGNMAAQASDLANEAVYMSHENVLNRVSGVSGDAALGDELWPKETYAEDEYDFHLNGEGVQFFHIPSAHTDGDSIVFFRRSDVIVAGDLWDTGAYPRIDTKHGGSINGLLAGLTRIIQMTIPGNKQEGGTLVVPGRGRPGDEGEVVEYRDMLTIIRDRIKDMADKGMTLEQVKAAKPTFDYDGRYGSNAGPWTTDMFITAVYEGVKPQRPQRRGSR